MDKKSLRLIIIFGIIAGATIPVVYYVSLYDSVLQCFDNPSFLQRAYCSELIVTNSLALSIAEGIEARELEEQREQDRQDRIEEQRRIDQEIREERRELELRNARMEEEQRHADERARLASIEDEKVLEELRVELESMIDSYITAKTEWDALNDSYDNAKNKVDSTKQRLEEIDHNIRETYSSSGFSEWEEGLFQGSHCRDYLSHSDKKVGLFCKAVEEFRKLSLRSVSAEELNSANFDARNEIVGLDSLSKILRCDSKLGLEKLDCRKKASALTTHNAQWLQQWNERTSAQKALVSLEIGYQDAKEERNNVQPQWEEVSHQYNVIVDSLCQVNRSYCQN